MEKNLKKQSIEISNKGFPLNSYGKTVEQFLVSKPNIFSSGFQFPIMVLKDNALKHNIDRMARFCKSVGAELAPHVKTTMSPQIAQMQVDAGAFALTIANFWQAEIFRSFGFKKLIIANEVLDPSAIAAISELNGKQAAEIIFYVDSLAGLEIIKKYTSKDGIQNLFIEIGTDNGRGGVRDLDLVTTIAKNISEDPRLKLRGVTGFEGAVPNAARTSAGEDSVTKFCQKIVAAANNAFPYKSESEFIISAGGSAYFEIVASELNKFDKSNILLLRSGGYVTHDSKYYEEVVATTKAAGSVFKLVDQAPLLDMQSANALGNSWQVGIDNQRLNKIVDRYEPLIYRPDSEGVSALAQNYLKNTTTGVTAILRPTYPDSTNRENLAKKVDGLTKLGISEIDFYLLDTMRSNDLESIKSVLN